MSNVSSEATTLTNERLIDRYKKAKESLDRCAADVRDAREATAKIERAHHDAAVEYMGATTALAQWAAGERPGKSATLPAPPPEPEPGAEIPPPPPGKNSPRVE